MTSHWSRKPPGAAAASSLAAVVRAIRGPYHRAMRRIAGVLLVIGLLVGASSMVAGSAPDGRPYGLTVPAGHDKAVPAPLVVVLHGYSSDGAEQAEYFGLADLAEREGFLLAYPDGTRDGIGNRFWNATDACCNFSGSTVDDVAYLDQVIAEIKAGHNVDPRRVYLVGHSNGAFMSHRYACDRPGTVAAIVALAGMQWKDPARCGATPADPVSVLHVHGDQDSVIEYGGGRLFGAEYPGAEETMATWAAKAGCAGALEATGSRLDLDDAVAGAETRTVRRQGCPAGIDDELWTIEGGGHVPSFNANWAASIYGFLAAHPKPAGR